MTLNDAYDASFRPGVFFVASAAEPLAGHNRRFATDLVATFGKAYNRASSRRESPGMADADKAAEKQRRLAEALRENLKRRKTAARKIAGDRQPGETEPVADGGKG